MSVDNSSKGAESVKAGTEGISITEGFIRSVVNPLGQSALITPVKVTASLQY